MFSNIKFSTTLPSRFMYTELSLMNSHESLSSFHSLYFQVLVQIIIFFSYRAYPVSY